MGEPNIFRFAKGLRRNRGPASLGALALALALGTGFAHAEKVGVAAAVNPDAFSSLSGVPNKQLNIGKSIFYNERINTTTSGLVQVLLVDGSTFTVGPNSDLVIDKFVYDPRKKTGELVATFSKGTMRFIGGKLSKNDGGVKVNTPAGALAIRGGMVQGQLNGSRGIFSFLYGVEMSLGNQRVYESGYTIDTTTGQPTIRPTTPADIKSILTALTANGGTGIGTGTGDTPGPTGPQQQTLAETLSLQQLIADATATQIDDTIQREEINQPIDTTPNTTPPGSGGGSPIENPNTENPNTENPNVDIANGYTGGVYTQTDGNSDDPPAGTLTSFAPNDFNLVFDKETKAFQGAAIALFVDHPSDRGGATVLVDGVDVPNISYDPDIPLSENSGPYLGLSQDEVQGPSLSNFIFAGVADTDAISIYETTTLQDGRPKLDNETQLNSGNVALVGFTGLGDLLCNNCDEFLTWGAWATLDPLNFQTGNDPASNVDAVGWWVSGDIVKDVAGALPLTGSASYHGSVLGEVWNNISYEGPVRYTATGDMEMNWSFASRTGRFDVRDFDKQEHGGYIPGGIDFGGDLSAPGIVGGKIVPTGKLNQFSGSLTETRVPGNDLKNLTGNVTGSFVGATKLPNNLPGNPKGVIGNWNIGNPNYKAGGIFAGSQSVLRVD